MTRIIWFITGLLTGFLLLLATGAHADTEYTCAGQGTPFGSGFVGCTDGPFTLTWGSSNGGGIALPIPSLNTADTYTVNFDYAIGSGPLHVYTSPSYPTPDDFTGNGHATLTITGADGLQMQAGNTGMTGTVTNLTICGGSGVDPCIGPPVPLGGASSSVDQSQQNVFFFAWTFLATMFGMIWLMRKH